ncbi:MAG TPA: hypothetical protein VGS21_10055, partial [Acidimicrobiales bacterium]|nr:hypothetical protein [Acidimicrobiales bacterium]
FGAVALAVALGVGRFPVAVAGCALFGLGLSVVVPTVLSEGARRAGPSGTSAVLAALSTCGIAGYLLGPPVIGGLASAISLPVALGLLPLLAAVIAVLARTIRPPA